jgi:hypothetical protein
LAQYSAESNERICLENSGAYFKNTLGKKILLSSFANVYTASNALPNSFVKDVLQGNFIDNADKDLTSGLLSKSNVLGAMQNFGLQSLFYKKNTTWMVSLSHHEWASFQFAPDMFELLMRGNKPFAGKTAVLDDSHFHYFNFDMASVGLAKSKNKWSYFLTAHIQRGGYRSQVDISQAQIYTSPQGDQVNLNHQMRFENSKVSLATLPITNGIGMAMSAGLNLDLDQHVFNMEIHHLGGMYWWNQVFRESKSNTYQFKGVDLDSLQNFQNTDQLFSLDSVASMLGFEKKEQNTFRAMPAKYLLSYTYRLNSKIQLMLATQYFSLLHFRPLYLFKSPIKLGNTWMLIPGMQYGGFGKLAFDLGASKTIGKHFLISSNIFLIDYLLFPKNSAVLGANISLSKYF